jgi:hypothetical protein
MFPFPILYVKIAILSVLVLGTFGSGWYVGHSKYVEYKKQVEIAAKAQEEKVKSIRSQQELVTKGIQNEYDAKLALLRTYYANGMHKPSTSALPSFSATPSIADVSAAYTSLIGQCAQTTQQLVSLQEWINEQIGIK